MARRSAAEYEAMAQDYEDNSPTADEVLGVEVVMGRPRADANRGGGKTPSMSVRFPHWLRAGIRARAATDFGGNEADVVRAAVASFLVVAPTAAKKTPAKKTVAKKATRA